VDERDVKVIGEARQASRPTPDAPRRSQIVDCDPASAPASESTRGSARLDVVEGELRPSAGNAAAGGVAGGGNAGVARPYLQVLFRCANQYLRVYRSADGSGYLARCPKCAKCMNFRVGPGGSGQRFFEVGC